LDRYLNEKGYGVSICRGEEFKTSRDVLSAKGKSLKKKEKAGKSTEQKRSLPRKKRYLIEIVLLLFFYKKYIIAFRKTFFQVPPTCI